MPKETVQHARITVHHEEPPVVLDEHGGNLRFLGAIMDHPYQPDDVLGPNDTLIEGSSVSVYWGRDSENVQLAIEAPRDWWENIHAALVGSPELPRFEVYTETLNRKEINDLIRVLRRARDAAYGGDE